MRNVLFLGGLFPDEKTEEILQCSKAEVQFAANKLQRLFLKSLDTYKDCTLSIVSAPFVNPYPIGYSKAFIPSWSGSDGVCYVPFINVWGLRNISREISLKKAVRHFAESPSTNKTIVAYSPHVPLLAAGVYAKTLDSSIRLLLILPDLPQYVALEHRSFIYSFFKRFDIKKFYSLLNKVDGFVVLTEQMNPLVNKANVPYVVVEGIAEYCGNVRRTDSYDIVYTGTLHKRYGILDLLEAFSLIEDPKARLRICGRGDSENAVEEACRKDKRIIYHGQQSNAFCIEMQRRASVLVNPRKNVGEYTKYSFPSKNLEYLSTGNPVVCYKLDGIPAEYDDFFIYPEAENPSALAKAIVRALRISRSKQSEYSEKVRSFICEEKSAMAVAQKISAIVGGPSHAV